MTLKFCSPPWGAIPLSVPSNHFESDEDWARGQRSSSDDLLTTALQAKQIDKSRQWVKEFSVFFDDSKPVGLGFQPALLSNPFIPDFFERYACVIRNVAPTGLAADYNAHCRAAGDYSRIIVDKLHVRMVNGTDVSDISYDDVLQMMRDAKPALTLTLADINSGQATSVLEERSKSVGNLASGRLSRRKSSLSLGTGKNQRRRNSQPDFKIAKDCSRLSQGMTLDFDSSNREDFGDLVASQRPNNGEVEVKTVQQECEESAKEKHEVATEVQRLLQETHKVQQERDEMIAINKLLLRHKRASVTTQVELDTVKKEQLCLLRRQEELEQTVIDLRTQLAEQMIVAEARQDQVVQLQHDKEMVELQWQELQEEHLDTQNQVTELHDRLVDAQRAHRAANFVHAALQTAHAAKTKQVQELQAALETVSLSNAEAAPQKQFVAENRQKSIVTAQADPKTGSALSQLLHERLMDANTDMNKHRDEVLEYLACHEQQLQQLQEQVRALELLNVTNKQFTASLHSELREAQSRECKIRRELRAELEAVRRQVEQKVESI